VINIIKDSREIKKTKSSDFLLSHALDDVMHGKKRGFSGMVGFVSRLKGVQKAIRREMMSETLLNHLFS